MAQVVSLLESGVRESFSGRGGHLCVPNAGVRDGESSLSIAIVDGVHGAVSARNLSRIEPILIRFV